MCKTTRKLEKVVDKDLINIESGLRLNRFKEIYEPSFLWYQDVKTVYMTDGVKEPYDLETLHCMYNYLNKNGELYYIEVFKDGEFEPIGDACFSEDSMSIVIGDKSYRGCGIGRKVISALIKLAKEKGLKELKVEIYDWNIASKRCFLSLGFNEEEKTEKGYRYILKMI